LKQLTKLKVHLLLIILTVFLSLAFSASGQSEEAGTLRNPLNPYGGADPWIQYYDGYYYLATTTWRSELLMSKSPTLAGLKTAIPQQIYAETDPSRCCNMWAPEFYLLDNGNDESRWYFYYSAGTSGTLDNQHSHVLESAGTDPMGPYIYKARIYDTVNDVWSIDGSILEIEDDLYFLFSSWVGANQSMFIAPMSDPWTLSGSRELLSQPEYDWERVGLNVNEGPVALYHDDDIFIIYSASHCATPDYKLGMLTYNGGDPLDKSSWEKHPEPVFQQSATNSVYGSAHNGFFTSPDGTENWIVYHANDSISRGCDDGRTTRVQKFTWNDDGTPNFGIPVSTDMVINAPSGDNGIDPIPEFAQIPLVRFRSMSYADGYLRHTDEFARVDIDPSPIGDSQFYIIAGLADGEAISIRSINLPSHFLRHDGNSIHFAPNDGSDEFAQSATWRIIVGLADEDWISLEAYDQEGYVIGQQFGIVALVEVNENMTDRMREDATFMQD
jgi:GH43 family beta-xylosidase